MSSMTDVSIGMMSYYNPLAMYRQPQHQQFGCDETEAQQLSQHVQQQLSQQVEVRHAAMQKQAVAAAAAAAAAVAVVSSSGESSPSQQYWYGYSQGQLAHAAHHNQMSAPQYLDHPADVLGWPHHSHYSHHLQYQHQQPAYHHQQHHDQHQQPLLSGTVSEWSGDESTGNIHHHHDAVGTGEPSPPITISGSEISSPGTPSTPPSNNNNNNSNTANNNNSATSTPIKTEQLRSPFEWMNKPSYQSQPNPGKTRTKDKYRVVYTDYQRLELEKEFHFSRYITIRRKAELAANLALSERQVKIWFQNRRAKERKQTKKREESQLEATKLGDMGPTGGMAALAALGGMGGMLGGLMHNSGGSPPPSPHGLGNLGHPSSPLHPHNHQHAILGL